MAEIITPKQFTRRDLLRLASIGIVGAAVAPAKSASSGTRALLAARGMAMGGGKRIPTAADYVQSGLVAMWDGIENAGFGVHDSDATEWKDLVCEYDLSCANVIWNADSAGFDGTGYANREGILPRNDYNTVEVVMRLTNQSSGSGAFCLGGGDLSENYGLCAIWSNYGSRVILTAGRNKPNYNMINAPDLSVRRSVSLNYVQSGFVSGTIDMDALTINGRDYRIACSPTCLGHDGSTRAKMIGEICNLRVYDHALTSSEVAANYAVDCARFNLT